MSRLKPILFSTFEQAHKLLWGTGIGRIPGVNVVSALLFERLWPDKSPVVEIQGSKMYVDSKGLPKGFRRTLQTYAMRKTWEELTTDLFKEVVKEGNVVVDLGANIGYYSLLAARLVGSKGRVYAFEPEPTNYSLLLKNIELNGYHNIIPVSKAVSNAVGTVRLFLDNQDTGAHTICEPGKKGKPIEVESVTLDEFFKDREPRIDVIKMDIEGAEMSALVGMDRILKENNDLRIFVEFYLPGIARSGSSPQEFIRRLLEDYHFSVLAIGEYTKDRKYLKIDKVDELMDFCKGEKTANLFLERK